MLLSLFIALAFAEEPDVGTRDAASPPTTAHGSAQPALDRNGKPIEARLTTALSGARTARGRAAAETFTLSTETATTQRFAMRQAFTSQLKNPNPFTPSDWKSTHTLTWNLIEWRELDGVVEYREQTCHVETMPVFGAETLYTPAFVRGVPVRFRRGKVSGTEVGSDFQAGPYVQQFGVDLADPFVDPLPSDPADPRLVDDDGDGKPGVTIVIRHPLTGEGHIWVGQRSVARLEGKRREGGVIEGYIRTAPDMFKIETDRWWLNTDAPQRPHPDPTQSPFMMVPVEQGLDCAKLLASRDTLFPPLPALD